MFNKEEAVQLQSTLDGLKNSIEFTLYQTQESEFGQRMESFVGEICRLSRGKIRSVPGGRESSAPAYPCFRLGSQRRANITYAAIPMGHQFGPFLKALQMASLIDASEVEAGAVSAGSNAELQVLVSEHCPRCPLVVEAVTELANSYPSISSHIIDAGYFPHITEKYGIKSVPATILDRRLLLVGGVSGDRLRELVAMRGTEQFEMEVVGSLIEAGKIEEAADSLDGEAGRKVVLSLMQELDFSKRLSAIVVMEQALDNKPDAVRTMIPALAELLSHSDARIRGDVADLLGKTRDPQVIPQLEPLTTDPDPDVAEAAAEAIEELRNQDS